MLRYWIKHADSLYLISLRFNIPVNALLYANPDLNPAYLMPGAAINIPMPEYRYVTYDILGSASNLSAAEMNIIMKWRKYIVGFAKAHPGEVFINGQATEKKISLTFDDGPDSKVTPAVLNILNKNKVKGSFSFVGTQINYFPNTVKTAYEEGHLILNHSWDHPYFTKLNSQGVKDEIIRTENRIQAIIGRKPALLRPPYGDLDEQALASVSSTNTRSVIWSIDSMDWVRNIDRGNIVNNVVNNARPGDIVLMHSSVGQIAVLEVLQIIIDELKKRSFKIVDLGELLNLDPYKQ